MHSWNSAGLESYTWRKYSKDVASCTSYSWFIKRHPHFSRSMEDIEHPIHIVLEHRNVLLLSESPHVLKPLRVHKVVQSHYSLQICLFQSLQNVLVPDNA
jgi:hypothetical protein